VLNGKPLLGQIQRALLIAQRVGIGGQGVEAHGRIGVPVAEQVTADAHHQ